jgi:DNA-directed RNA polymerase subunit M
MDNLFICQPLPRVLYERDARERETHLMFCPKCKCLLFPQDGKLVCRKCGAVHELKNNKSQIITHKSTEKEDALMGDLSGTLPTADVECPSCLHGKAYWVLRQMRGADEPETRIFRCVKCGRSWREQS